MKNCFIIVNYNDAKSTRILLNNIMYYDDLDEIVVVDNKSKDDSLEELEPFKSDHITIIENDFNNGYSSALNIGARYLIDKYNECNIFVSNSDIIIPSSNTISIMIKELKGDVVIVSPTIQEQDSIIRGWKIPKPIDDIILNLPIFGKILEKGKLKYKDSHYKKNISYVDTVSGCFFLISSTHLEKMNFFDENVFLYYEENIFGLKTKRLKKKIAVCNTVSIIHNCSVSVDKSVSRINKYKILKQSQYYFEKKYNKANIIELGLLKLTAFITKIFLSIIYILD